jgi:hypothetical protein
MTVPSVFGARTDPSATTTSSLSMNRLIVIAGWPAKPSSTMCVAKAPPTPGGSTLARPTMVPPVSCSFPASSLKVNFFALSD